MELNLGITQQAQKAGFSYIKEGYWMARRKTLRLSALNIKTEPHTQERYVHLIQFVFGHSILGKLSGHNQLMIGVLESLDTDDPMVGFKGFLYRFTNIDRNAPWLDIGTRELVESDSAVQRIIIPEDLRPNCKKIPFVFDAQRHRLIFESTSPTAPSIRVAFESIFNDPMVQEEFGLVDVELEVRREAIEYILGLENIRKLEIRVSRPNPDDISELEDEVYRRLQNQNVRRIDETLTAASAEGILPDQWTKGLIAASRSDGSTVARAIIGGEKKEVSTSNKPLIVSHSYDPYEQSLMEAMTRGTNELLEEVFSTL